MLDEIGRYLLSLVHLTLADLCPLLPYFPLSQDQLTYSLQQKSPPAKLCTHSRISLRNLLRSHTKIKPLAMYQFLLFRACLIQ